MLDALVRGPAAYMGRSGWPVWAVLPAAVLIFALAALIGGAFSFGYAFLSGAGLPAAAPGTIPPQMMMQLAAWIIGLQVGMIVLTVIAAGFFSSNRAAALALKPPAGGWWVLPLALIPLFLITAAWTGLLLWWQPSVVIQDLRPFQQLLQGDTLWLILAAICIGAPFSEELLFRGFLFSALAKSRLGLIGTSLVTTVLWTSLHAGYSIFGLIEVLGIGLYLSWVLVRTGSLWVTIFCHAAYNTVIATALLFVTLPAGG